MIYIDIDIYIHDLYRYLSLQNNNMLFDII